MTSATSATTSSAASRHGGPPIAKQRRLESRPVRPSSPATTGGASHPHPAPTEPDLRRAASRHGPVRPAASDPTAARRPLPAAAALAETNHLIDRSAGPDRTGEIDRLRATVAQTADLLQSLAEAEYHRNGSQSTSGAHPGETDGAAIIGLTQDRLQREVDALRGAEAAQHVRQNWLDAHPEIVAHLRELSMRRRRAGRRPGPDPVGAF